MSMCESILTIALVCTVKYLHYCDYYYTLGNDSQSTPKLIAYRKSIFSKDMMTENLENTPSVKQGFPNLIREGGRTVGSGRVATIIE